MNLNNILFANQSRIIYKFTFGCLLINKSKMSCKTLDLTNRPDASRLELLNYVVEHVLV